MTTGEHGVGVVLGLGNPGDEYRETRHNLGFWTVDRLAERRGVVLRAEGAWRREAWAARTRISRFEVVLAKPRTYMNRSGHAAATLCRLFDARPEALVVVHDDADLELGRLRIRRGGGSGGHNGLRSLVDVLGTAEFLRVRLGVRGEGRAGGDLADYVLEPFATHERPVAEELAGLGADAVEALLDLGLEEAMNRFNGRSAGGGSRTDRGE